MKPISTKRRLFVQLLCFALICGFVYHSWLKSDTHPSAGKQAVGLTGSYAEKIFRFEAQSAVYARHSLAEAKPGEPAAGEAVETTVLKPLTRSLRELYSPLHPPAEGISDLQRSKLILSLHLGLVKETRLFCRHLRAQREQGEPALDNALLTRCPDAGEEAGSLRPELSRKQLELIERRLGWFGSLLRADVEGGEAYFQEQVIAPAKQALFQVGKIALLAGTAAVLSFICLVGLIAKAVSGRLRFQFRLPRVQPSYLLEIFTLYLLAMFMVPLLLQAAVVQGAQVNVLLANIVMISCMLLLAFWPLFCRQDRAMLEESLGLHSKPVRETLRDIASGPFAYFASLSGLLAVLVVYAFVLTALGVEPGSGAHPVVPLLSRASEWRTIFYIFLLAVVVAPVVEEVMFRGAFYGWLRSRFGAPSSAAFSALIFAAVHPQGALGVVPLTCIGLVLAFLREWRGTLTAPIAAHACFNAGTLLLALKLLR